VLLKRHVSKVRKSSFLRGQAMVEYSLVSHFLIMGGGLALMPVIAKLYEGLNAYYESIYFVLKSGAI
jgi:hypothetical protein